MKKLILALTLLTCTNSAFAIGPNIPHPYDYISHSMGGFVIADYMQRKGYSKWTIILTVAAVAVAKEATDKNFDKDDALAWLPGAGLRFSIPLD